MVTHHMKAGPKISLECFLSYDVRNDLTRVYSYSNYPYSITYLLLYYQSLDPSISILAFHFLCLRLYLLSLPHLGGDQRETPPPHIDSTTSLSKRALFPLEHHDTQPVEEQSDRSSVVTRPHSTIPFTPFQPPSPQPSFTRDAPRTSHYINHQIFAGISQHNIKNIHNLGVEPSRKRRKKGVSKTSLLSISILILLLFVINLN